METPQYAFALALRCRSGEEPYVFRICLRQDFRLLPGDTGLRWDGRLRSLIVRKRTRLGVIRIAGWRRQQLISQQHREIFVNGVVTVIDVGTAELAEPNLKLDA